MSIVLRVIQWSYLKENITEQISKVTVLVVVSFVLRPPELSGKKTMSKRTENEIVNIAPDLTLSAGNQDSQSTPAIKTSRRPIPLRSDVYDLFYELCMAIKFKRLELEWISIWEIADAGNDWGTTFKNERLSFALIRFLMEMFVASQPMIIDGTLIEPDRQGNIVLYRFIPTLVKDLNVKWDDSIEVIPAPKIAEKEKVDSER